MASDKVAIFSVDVVFDSIYIPLHSIYEKACQRKNLPNEGKPGFVVELLLHKTKRDETFYTLGEKKDHKILWPFFSGCFMLVFILLLPPPIRKPSD